MKMDVKQFSNMIREVVRDEIRKSLPGMVEKAITEQYLRKIVKENTTLSRPPLTPATRRTLENTFINTETEEIPAPIENPDHGIYAEDPMIKKANEVKQALLSKSPAMAALYEGTQPLTKSETGPQPGEVSEAALARLGVLDPNKMRNLVSGGKTTGPAIDEARLVQLQEQRRRLDTPVGGGPSRSATVAPTPARARIPNPFFDADNAFEPIVLTPDM